MKEFSANTGDHAPRNVKKEVQQALLAKYDENQIPNSGSMRNDALNQSKLKKYLYLEANELKTQYHEVVIENKKLETKLKQIEKDKQKIVKQLNQVKNNPTPAYAESKTKINNNANIGILSENPTDLKQKIREKRDVYDEHLELLEELKIKVKGDNLLLLSNQCIYQQKLLLNKKQAINKLLTSGVRNT